MAQAMVLMQKRMEEEIKAFQGMQKGARRVPPTALRSRSPPPSFPCRWGGVRAACIACINSVGACGARAKFSQYVQWVAHVRHRLYPAALARGHTAKPDCCVRV